MPLHGTPGKREVSREGRSKRSGLFSGSFSPDSNSPLFDRDLETEIHEELPADPVSVNEELNEIFFFIHVRVHAEGIHDLEREITFFGDTDVLEKTRPVIVHAEGVPAGEVNGIRSAPLPGTIAISCVVAITLLIAAESVSGTSAMTMRTGPRISDSFLLRVSFRPSGTTSTGHRVNAKGAVDKIRGRHPALQTASTTSQSIALANSVLSSGARTQERRVLGFSGLKGMIAGIPIIAPSLFGIGPQIYDDPLWEIPRLAYPQYGPINEIAYLMYISIPMLSQVITYSKNVFLPLTTVCHNRCKYCSFRTPVQEGCVMQPQNVLDTMKRGASLGCTEALFTFGERPGLEPGFEKYLSKYGYSDILDYCYDMNEMAIKIGLLPHTNAGVLTQEEMERLSEVNASMGLMLETTAQIKAHENSPGKDPVARIEMIESAGRLRIPFTTGILLGIGETARDREESLTVIRDLHRRYDHIQEVIIRTSAQKRELLWHATNP